MGWRDHYCLSTPFTEWGKGALYGEIMAFTRKQYALLEEIDCLLRYASHLEQVSLTVDQWKMWLEILKRATPKNDPRFDIEGSRYRQRRICKLGEEQRT